MNPDRLIILLIILFILLGILIFVWWYFAQSGFPSGNPSPTVITPRATSTPTPSPSTTSDQTANWKTYTNTKYGYSFKYPADYEYAPCTQKPCKNFVYDKLPGYPEKDYVLLEGDISEKGWPNITVSHLSSSFYNPPQGIDLISWLKQKSPQKEYVPDTINYEIGGVEAVKVEVPASPQAYGSWLIYFIKDNKLFEIELLDPATNEAKDFYNLFLNNFQVNI